MKNQLLKIAILLLLSTSSHGQILNFDWAKSYGGVNNDRISSFMIDQSSNLYSVGYFYDIVDFDPGKNIFNLTSLGSVDMFIQKLNKDGDFEWAKPISGSNSIFPSQIVLDSDQNLYIIGTFQDTVDFDPSSEIHELTSNGIRSSFLLKLDHQGNFLWVKKFGGSFSRFALDKSNHAFITGSYSDTIDVDPSMNEFNLISNGRSDFFILKLDDQGDFLWAKSIGGTSFDNCTDIIFDNQYIYLSGTFRDIVDFDPSPNQSNIIGDSGKSHNAIFLLKLDSLGNFIFVESIGGNGHFSNGHLHMDQSGDLYLGGYYLDTADFDFSTNEFLLTSNGLLDIFVQKINTEGDLIWAKSIGGNGAEFLHYITTDKLNNVYISGQFSSESDFDPGTSDHYINSNGKNDGFIEKLDADGNFIWVATQGGLNNDANNIIQLDKDEYIYSIGYFNDTTDIDPSMKTYNLMSNGKSDNFIQKFKQCYDNHSIDTVIACEEYTWIDNITYTTNNTTSTFTLKNISGCDSVVTLNLEIKAASSSVDVIIACDSYTWINGITYTENNNNAKDAILNINGCDSVISLDLTINKVNVAVTTKDHIITANEPNLTYQWLNCNESFSTIQDATNQSYSPQENGNYAVEITQNSCIDTSICIEIMTVHSFDNSNFNQIRISPNPASDQFVIQFDDFNITETRISLFNIDGKNLLNINKTPDQNFVNIDVRNLLEGLHLVQIQIDDKETIYKKVIIKRK